MPGGEEAKHMAMAHAHDCEKILLSGVLTVTSEATFVSGERQLL